jgi:accessory colonization factor AcfC
MIIIIWLVLLILFVIWNEWDISRKKKQDWKELETNSRIINKAEMDKLSKQARRRERTAMEYLSTKQKKLFRKGKK